jgi:hypothetical protein
LTQGRKDAEERKEKTMISLTKITTKHEGYKESTWLKQI